MIPIEERFEVIAPVERVWDYFSNPSQVVPCLPGAELLDGFQALALGLQIADVFHAVPVGRRHRLDVAMGKQCLILGGNEKGVKRNRNCWHTALPQLD